MTEEEKKRSLAHIRMQQAEDSLDEARFLFEGHKSTRSVINRIYYAMFYPYFEQTRKFIDAVRALLKASKGV